MRDGVRVETVVEAARQVQMILRGFDKEMRQRIWDIAGILWEVEKLENKAKVITEAHEKQ